jgi:hypothetical protein
MKLKDGSGRELDAEFELERMAPQWALVLHSRSGGNDERPARNPEYSEALELMLERIAAAGGHITSIAIDSLPAQKFPPADRVLPIGFPIDLVGIGDLGQLRRDICSAQRATLRSPKAKVAGGNNNKRIRILVAVNWTDVAEAIDALGATSDVGNPAGSRRQQSR